MKINYSGSLFLFLIPTIAFSSTIWEIDASTPPNFNGGYLPDGDSDNTITVDGLTTSGVVFGGYYGDPSNNSISVVSSNVGGVVGGFRDNSSSISSVMSGNTIVIDSSKITGVTMGSYNPNVILNGGATSSRVVANNNLVTLRDSEFYDVGGGKLGYGQESSNNRVTIIRSNFKNGAQNAVSGGWVWNGVANNNYVYLEDSTAYRVIGGWGAQVDGNTVVLLNSKVRDIYVAQIPYTFSLPASATNNTLELRGESSVETNVYGGDYNYWTVWGSYRFL